MLPTTLLAQVDAAIGGKTGVNGRLAKNLAGAFHPPLLVLSDPCLLASLPERELAGGYAEVVKTAMIGDRDLFARLERELVMRGTPAGRQSGSASGPAPAPGGTADPRRDPELLQACVAGCMRVKGGLVGRDPWDLGDRQLLNLGHTLGHALEAESGFGLSHGEAVSLGLLAAIRLAIGRGLAGGELLGRTRRLLSACGLPIRAPAYEPEELRARLGLDKKRTAGRLRFILPAGIGRVAAVDDVGEDEALASLQEVSRCASS
jgi:3-dehydroquinate synthase